MKLGNTEEQHCNPLTMFDDADWGEDAEDRKSNTGYFFRYQGATITWTSRKQSMITLSSTEAECIALAEALHEAIYVGVVRLRQSALDQLSVDCIGIVRFKLSMTTTSMSTDGTFTILTTQTGKKSNERNSTQKSTASLATYSPKADSDYHLIRLGIILTVLIHGHCLKYIVLKTWTFVMLMSGSRSYISSSIFTHFMDNII